MSTVSNNSLEVSLPKVVLIFGPTAVGKTSLVSHLARFRVEIINADSMQVYRRLDIGTAKPPAELLEAVPHHLINICEPERQFNAGEFVNAADRLVREISGRGSVPVVCGGTPFYFRNFMFGLPETPPGDPEVRASIKLEIQNHGLEQAYSRLQSMDPAAAERIAANDRYRIERALEVITVTGRPFSKNTVSGSIRKDIEMLCVGLDRPREELYRRINRRVTEMFADGLVGEVASLLKSGYGPDCPGMQGIGYRELVAMASVGCSTLGDVEELIARNSRRYAKRQLTFFRKFPDTTWFHPDEAEAIEEMIEEFLRG